MYIASFVVSLISSLFPYIPIFIEGIYGINSLFYFIILSLSFPYVIFVILVNKNFKKNKVPSLTFSLLPFFDLCYTNSKKCSLFYLPAIFFGIYTSFYWIPRHALLMTEGGYKEKEMSKFYIITFLIKSTSFLFIAFLIEHLGFVFTFALLSLLSPMAILISPRKHYEVRIYKRKKKNVDLSLLYILSSAFISSMLIPVYMKKLGIINIGYLLSLSSFLTYLFIYMLSGRYFLEKLRITLILLSFSLSILPFSSGVLFVLDILLLNIFDSSRKVLQHTLFYKIGKKLGTYEITLKREIIYSTMRFLLSIFGILIGISPLIIPSSLMIFLLAIYINSLREKVLRDE